MRLADLIRCIGEFELKGSADVQVCGIAHRASDAAAGCCFVAIPGHTADGHGFAAEAAKRGAVAVVSERSLDLPVGVTGVVTKDARRALARMSAAFFGEPSKGMKLVGVTGTNGKTTITYLLEAIFSAAGMRPGVIGTVAHRFDGFEEPSTHTTPGPYELQGLLSRMREAGVEACAMEVSSHALSQGRAVACHFDAAVFTNLTPEHLDYHSDMESYFSAKAILFEDLLAESSKRGAFAAINARDPRGELLASRCPVPAILYGLDSGRDVRGSLLASSAEGVKVRVEASGLSLDLASRLCGRFNAENILAAVAVAARMGIDSSAIAEGVSSLSAVPGRFESVPNGRGFLALVDYAHTPDALENALIHARELAGGKVIVVFGCGGDRDRAKRPLMGRAAAKLSDVAIVTSDNPRTEEPDAIIAEIMAGVRREAHHHDRDGRGYEVIPDRKEAIARAVEIAREGDVLLVAGKGHEDYQIIGTERRPFDDREVLRGLLR